MAAPFSTAAGLNRTINTPMLKRNSGRGIWRASHSWTIRRVPVPQCSIKRARWKATASSGLRGRDGCSWYRASTEIIGQDGRIPDLQTVVADPHLDGARFSVVPVAEGIGDGLSYGGLRVIRNYLILRVCDLPGVLTSPQ